jgi:hypothetical protein
MIKKYLIKKRKEKKLNWVISSNSWPRLWDWDNPTKRKANKNYEAQSITNPTLKMKFKTKANFIKETKKKIEVNSG